MIILIVFNILLGLILADLFIRLFDWVLGGSPTPSLFWKVLHFPLAVIVSVETWRWMRKHGDEFDDWQEADDE
jgi:hypothetical protein